VQLAPCIPELCNLTVRKRKPRTGGGCGTDLSTPWSQTPAGFVHPPRYTLAPLLTQRISFCLWPGCTYDSLAMYHRRHAMSSSGIARSLAAVVLLLCMFVVGLFLQLSLFYVHLKSCSHSLSLMGIELRSSYNICRCCNARENSSTPTKRAARLHSLEKLESVWIRKALDS